ncbi:hypothetical protein ACQPXM_11305 [Kribbella sp. CA-253562]|uniref:hypothetical protein n=1 Tax=Kribbella sp. CA-253562 TaxID=3239942 RepID=UPI003D8C4858
MRFSNLVIRASVSLLTICGTVLMAACGESTESASTAGSKTVGTVTASPSRPGADSTTTAPTEGAASPQSASESPQSAIVQGGSGAAIVPAGLRMTHAGEQDGEALVLGFTPELSASETVKNYREQLQRAGWKIDGLQAARGSIRLSFAAEDPLFIVSTKQIRIPDLTFKRMLPVSAEDGSLTLHFDHGGSPEAAMKAYKTKLTKLGYRVTEVGDSYEAVKAGTVMQFTTAVGPGTLELQIERLS